MTGSACPICGDTDIRPMVRKGGVNIVRCRGCGVGFQDPLPDENDLEAIYDSGYFADWAAEPVRRMKAVTFGHLLAQARPWIRPGARVQDVGCATGIMLDTAKQAGLEPYGVDVSPHAIDECERRLGAGHFYCGQLQDAAFPALRDPRFGAIFMCDYIEHVRSPRAVIEQAVRSLETGAPLVLTTPDLAHITRRVMGARWPHFNAEHLWYFSPSNLRRLMNEAGLRIVLVRSSRKALSMEYVLGQLQKYPMPVVTPLLDRLTRILPARLTRTVVRVPTGDMTLIGIKV